MIVPSGYLKENPASSVHVSKEGVGVGVGVGDTTIFCGDVSLDELYFIYVKASPPTRIIVATGIKIRFGVILNAIINSMKMKNLMFFVLGIFFLFSTSTPTLAAKKRVWGNIVRTTSVSSSPVSLSAKLTGWKQYLNVSFKGVSSTKGISYDFIYGSNGIDQGLSGRVKTEEGNVIRSLFLGSCSFGVCTAHKNISNVRLSVSYQTLDGKVVVKNYKVKY